MTYIKKFENYKINNSDNIKTLPINIDFTYNKWGTFDIGDGENFSSKLNLDCDFFLFCERKNDIFYTTFIPNFINKKDTSDWDNIDNIDLFNSEITYKTTMDDLRKNLLKNANSTGFDVVSRDSKFNITNFDFYYAGLLGNNIYEKTPLGKHSKHKELVNYLKQNKYI